jgi:hypothetical protein
LVDVVGLEPGAFRKKLDLMNGSLAAAVFAESKPHTVSEKTRKVTQSWIGKHSY